MHDLGRPPLGATYLVTVILCWVACLVGTIWSLIRLGQRLLDGAEWTTWQIITPWAIGIGIVIIAFAFGFIYAVTKGDG